MDKQLSTLPTKPRKMRGWATYLGDEFSFKPTEEGTPSQLNVKTCKGGKTFETTSESKPLKVAHLTCPANAADPFAEYITQLENLGIKPHGEQQFTLKQRLVNEGGMEVFLNTKQNTLTYQGIIDLAQNRNWQSEVMRQMQVIMRTLPAHEKLTKVINKLKKGGKK